MTMLSLHIIKPPKPKIENKYSYSNVVLTLTLTLTSPLTITLTLTITIIVTLTLTLTPDPDLHQTVFYYQKVMALAAACNSGIIYFFLEGLPHFLLLI